MSKYIRYQAVVNRNSDENVSEDHWLKQFEKNLQKGAVQSRNQESLFDQINTIMNRKSKYPSVEAAVEDMKARSGLTAYLNKIKAEESLDAVKTAADENESFDKNIPIVIKKHPPIRKTLENCIRDTQGNLPIPAIIERVRSIHQGDVSEAKDWDEDKLIYLISNLNLEAKKKNPSNFQNHNNLGSRDTVSDQEIDPSNTDAFFSLNPAKI